MVKVGSAGLVVTEVEGCRVSCPRLVRGWLDVSGL